MLHGMTITTLLPARLVGTYRRRSVERSIRRTFATWMQRFPRWVNTGFDEYFLLHDALPLLKEMLTGQRYPDPALLAHTWVRAYDIPTEHTQRAVAEVTPVAADFLARLQIEYCASA